MMPLNLAYDIPRIPQDTVSSLLACLMLNIFSILDSFPRSKDQLAVKPNHKPSPCFRMLRSQSLRTLPPSSVQHACVPLLFSSYFQLWLVSLPSPTSSFVSMFLASGFRLEAPLPEAPIVNSAANHS